MPSDAANLTISLLALLVALAATWFAAEAYRQKAGVRIRGSYATTSTVDCDDKFVANVTLENLKDRSVVVFKIFLQVGHGRFVELDDFEKQPLILKPFEVIRREYDPIEFYSAGTTRVAINDLIDARKVRKRLVLAIPEGKYVVREWLPRWDPVYDFFRNHLTSIIHPIRATYDGKAYGGNVKYLVQLKMPDGTEELIPIRDRDHEWRVFRKFKLTADALKSSAALEEFLLARAVSGDLNCSDIVVRDLESWRKEAYEELRRSPVEIEESLGWFTYHVLGRAYTIWSTFKTRRANRRLRREPRTKQHPKGATAENQSNPERDSA